MAVSTRKVIRMTFLDSGGSTYTITIPDPKDNLTDQDILNAMDLIIQKNIIQGRSGDLVEKVDARIIETTTNDIYNP
ncbi:DUF2922 domain-containing protein [Dictyoglomus sp.]|uniref:DUF2922 domain-containing protein n=1 Tax=Dictyoglomus sp. TaxID=28205 RepID=UPI003D0A063A